jgi:hypothetical protein
LSPPSIQCNSDSQRLNSHAIHCNCLLIHRNINGLLNRLYICFVVYSLFFKANPSRIFFFFYFTQKETLLCPSCYSIHHSRPLLPKASPKRNTNAFMVRTSTTVFCVVDHRYVYTIFRGNSAKSAAVHKSANMDVSRTGASHVADLNCVTTGD